MLPTPLLGLLDNWANKEFAIKSSIEFKEAPSPIVPGEYIISAKRRLIAPFSRLPEIVVKEYFQTSMVAAAEFSKNHKADEHRLIAFLNYVDDKFIKHVTEAESAMIKELNPEGFF